jgi:hypothetical protein
MMFPHCMPLLRRSSVFAAVVLLAASVANAQSSSSSDSSSSAGYSSSQSGLTQMELAEFAMPAAPTPAGSGASSGGGGQYGNGGGGHGGFFHNHTWAFEAGGGFNAPIGNDTNQAGVVSGESLPVITWGGNFTVGGGWHFSKRLSVLAEYQFMDNKLPGELISAVNTAAGGGAYDISAGNTHINSITGSPVIDLTPKRTNGIYVVGGFGWYHKSTNFQAEEETFDPYYGYYDENVTVSSFTSNQWGGNAGLGLYHKLGGNMYGNSDSNHSEIFAEARYTFIHTPPASQANGLGTTELIPVTFGIRF